MRGLSPAATLDLWETADALGPIGRSLALAAAVEPPVQAEELEAMPLGRRDARLLRLRIALSGRTLEATAVCPSCDTDAEFEVDAAELLAREAEAVQPAPVEAGGFVVVARPPDSRDVAAAAAAGDAEAAELVLFARCVVSARGPGGEVDRTTLPPAVRDAVARALGDSDPLAEVLVDLECPACATSFVADLDLGRFVWAELGAQARRLLHEVDVLGRAYGWTESEVLALGERRRAAYVHLAHEGGP